MRFGIFLALVGAGCAVVAFGESLEEEPFVYSNEVLTAVYDANGGVLKRLFYKGREWTEPGMTSFRDRIFVQTGEKTEDSEQLFAADWEFVPSEKRSHCTFTRLASAIPGLRFTKRFRIYRAKAEPRIDELVADVVVSNLLDEARTFSLACGMCLLPPEGKTTFRMPTADGFKDTFCPGDGGDAFAPNPATRAFGVFDGQGTGFALVAPAGRLSGFYSWKNNSARQATAECFLNEVRLAPKGTYAYSVSLVFSDDVPALLTARRFAAGKPESAPSSHIRVWTEPGTLKVKTLREGPRPFKKTFDLDLRRVKPDSVYALDTEETDPAGLAVYPRLNGRTEYDRLLEVEPTVRPDGKVRLLVRVPPLSTKEISYEYRGKYAFFHGTNRGEADFRGHLVWNDPTVKHLPKGTIRETPLATVKCVPRPLIEVAREKLERDFKIPLDLLGHVDVSNPPYDEPWFRPGKPIDVLYLLQPGDNIIENGKWVLSNLAAMQPLKFRTLVVLPEVLGVSGNKPYSVYKTMFGKTVSDWTVESMKLVRDLPRVALVQNLDFAIAQTEFREILVRWNAAGTGLVFVDCANVPAELLGEPCAEATDEIAKAFPGPVRHQKAVAAYRKGNVLNATVSLDVRKNPATPKNRRGERYPVVGAREFPHVEYALLALAKAVRMSAGVAPSARIVGFGKGVVRLEASAPCVCTLEGEFRSPESVVERTFSQSVKLKAGQKRLPLELGSIPEGEQTLRLRLLVDGEVVDAAAYPYASAASVKPVFVFSHTNRIYRAEEKLAFDVTLAQVPEGATVEVEVEDGDFRIVRRGSAPAAARVLFSFGFPARPTKIYRVFAAVKKGEGVLARTMEEVAVRMAPVDFKDTSAYITISPTITYLMPLLRDLGFDFVICGFANGTAEAAIRNTAELGMISIPRNCAATAEWFRPYRGDNPGGNPVRTPCFSSDAYKAELRERILKRGRECNYDFYNVRYHWLGDECFLGSTVCYSPSCLAAFRAELGKTYGTIAALNAEWETSFASFADVRPCQLTELRSRDNLAPWLDHKMHMCRSFAANWIGGAKGDLNEVSPGSFCGPTGTQQGGHGFDWAELMKHIDAIGYYGGCQRKLIHDFADAYGRGILAGQCGGGYTHAQFDFEPYNYSTMWSGLLKGSNLAYHYFGAAIDGDMTMTSNMVYWTTSMRELKGGVGKLFLSGEETCEVAALHSQNSLFVAMGTDGVAGWHSSQSSWWRVLSDLKVPFRYVTREMLEKGLDAKYRALVLPAVHAMSAAERSSVAAFVKRGGRVLADVAPGRFDEHGRLAKGGPLAEPGIEALGADLAEYESVDLGGAAGETEKTAGAADDKARNLRTRVSAALARAGVRPPVSVRDAQGLEYPCDAVWREDGPNGIFAMHVDTKNAGNNGSDKMGSAWGRFDFTKGDAVVAKLPRKGHVYDIRAKRYVGFTDTVNTTLIPGYTRMYAVLAEKPGDLSVAGPEKVVRGEAAHFAFGVAGTSGAQTFHVELVAPDGTNPVHFRRNFREENGRGTYDFETAFNEKPGTWRLLVRHVNTGAEKELRFEVH